MEFNVGLAVTANRDIYSCGIELTAPEISTGMIVPSIPEEEEDDPEVLDVLDPWAPVSMTTVEIGPPPAGDPSPAGGEPTLATNLHACEPSSTPLRRRAGNGIL